MSAHWQGNRARDFDHRMRTTICERHTWARDTVDLLVNLLCDVHLEVDSETDLPLPSHSAIVLYSIALATSSAEIGTLLVPSLLESKLYCTTEPATDS
jgi:hypothetical protein